MNNIVLVSYKMFYEEEPDEVQSYLSGISKHDLFGISSHLLRTNNRHDDIYDRRKFIAEFFHRDQVVFAQMVYRRLNELDDNITSAKAAILSPKTILKLFEYAIQSEETINTKSYPDIYESLFNAFLVINQELTELESTVSRTTEGLDSNIAWVSKILTLSVATAEFSNYRIMEETMTNAIKLVTMFKFFEERQDVQVLINSFLEKYNIENLNGFIKAYFPIIAAIHQSTSPGYIDIVIPEGPSRSQSADFLDSLIVNLDSIFGIDFRILRGSPLYKVEFYHYRLIYDKFVVDKLYRGVYFSFLQLNELLNEGDGKIAEFSSFFSKSFVEEKLFYSCLNRVFANAQCKYSGDELVESGMTGEPDFYVRDGNKILLFESKNVMLGSEIKNTYNYNVVCEAIKERLYKKVDRRGRIKKKAILQLIENIKKVYSKQINLDTNYELENVEVFPILVTYDALFNSLGLNYLINQWFSDEIQLLDNEIRSAITIHPLIIINIDDFIIYEEAFVSGELDIYNSFRSYYQSVNSFDYGLLTNESKKKKAILPYHFFMREYSISRSYTPRIPLFRTMMQSVLGE